MIKKLLKNKTNLSLLLILLLSAFLRLYNINGFMQFLGDQGRDVLVAYNILHGHLTLLGPTASVGGFFLGPIYYYIIAPFLWIFRYDPIGPAIMVALFGVATTYLIYRLSIEFFDSKFSGIIASALFAVSPLVITYSRFSWNPNLMPFFTIILIYSLYKASINFKSKYFILTGIIFGICLQLHYLELFMAVVIFFYLLFCVLFFIKKGQAFKIILFLKSALLAILGFVIGFLPFLLFELRHSFLNSLNVYNFIFHSPNSGVSGNFLTTISAVFFRVFSRLLLNFPIASDQHLYNKNLLLIWGICSLILALFSIIFAFKIKNQRAKLLLLLWLFLGIGLFGLYHKAIYDYYFGFLFPLPFLLLGNAFYSLYTKASKNNLIVAFFLAFIFGAIFLVNLFYSNPFSQAPNYQKDQAKNIANYALTKTDNMPFNFALLTKSNSDFSYRYFFTIKNQVPVEILPPAKDPKRNSVTKQLIVICELPVCSPLDNPLWEIAGFGQAKIVSQYSYSNIKVFKLVHSP